MFKALKEFIAKEPVLCVAAICALATMFIVPPDKEYLHYIDFRVLCLLLCLMAVVAGLKTIGVFHWLTYQLLIRLNSGRALSVTLILLPFWRDDEHGCKGTYGGNAQNRFFCYELLQRFKHNVSPV